MSQQQRRGHEKLQHQDFHTNTTRFHLEGARSLRIVSRRVVKDLTFRWDFKGLQYLGRALDVMQVASGWAAARGRYRISMRNLQWD